ncbi:Gibberellin 20-oxidase-like protein [Linum grandiflorum]
MSQSATVKLPVFDISVPFSESAVDDLSAACKEWGFFHITNHGVSKELYSKVRAFSMDDLFSQPLDMKIRAGPSSDVKSYTPHFIASPFFESFRVSGPGFLDSVRESARVVGGPIMSRSISQAVEEYGRKMTTLSETIVKTILTTMNKQLVNKLYISHFKDCHGYLRIINYSPPNQHQEEVEGLGMHTDMSCVTIVCQDEIGGLQVRTKEGKWMDIEPRPDSLVVNIGDMLEAWSNGELRSSEHRVVLKRPVERFTLAFFWCFEDQKVIFAPDEVVIGKRRKYREFVCKEYLSYRETSVKGRFDKVGFTVRDFAGVGGDDGFDELVVDSRQN